MQKRMERYDYSDNVYEEFDCQNLSNLYERSVKELEDFWELFNWDKEIGNELLDPKSDNPEMR